MDTFLIFRETCADERERALWAEGFCIRTNELLREMMTQNDEGPRRLDMWLHNPRNLRDFHPNKRKRNRHKLINTLLGPPTAHWD